MLWMTLTAASVFLISASVATAQAAGQRVDVNGMKMYYEVSGAGDPLIVLHGAYMNIPSMGAIIPKLAKTHKVYALEFQGHGRTTDIERPITYQNLADDVATFMECGEAQESRCIRLFHGCHRGPTACHPSSRKGEQARRCFRRVRCRGLATGVHRQHPSDDSRDDPGD